MTGGIRDTDGAVHTARGTVGWFDHEARRLRHGPAATAPRNLVVRLEQGLGRLLVRLPDGVTLASCIPANWDAGPCRLVPLDDPFRFMRSDPARAMIGLSHAGAVLQAQANGRLSLLPDTGSADALFTVLAGRTLRIRDALVGGRWLDATTGQDAVWVAGGTPARPTVQCGELVCDLAGEPGPFVTGVSDAGASPRQVQVVSRGGRLHRFRRYDPVICFALFGANDLYFECLTMALLSLDVHGRYDGIVCVACDRPRNVVARHIPDSFRKRWIHVAADRRAGLFSRYTMAEWGLQAFQPLLYLDVDVVADRPLEPVLRALAVSDRMHAATENRLLPKLAGLPASAFAATTTGDWFGTWLTEGDPRFETQAFALGSSGILGFANIEVAREAFCIVRAMRRIADPALIAEFTDQALLNYALHCMGGADYALLDRNVGFVRGYDKLPARRRGLVHFHSGVGYADDKHGAMRRYLGQLSPACDLSGISGG